MNGRRQAGRYELLFELARGGMGVVWAARLVGAHGFDRLVAVKELLGDVDDLRSKESFLDEARVAAKIDHPNVLAPLELFEHEGKPFIAMELVRGVSLWRFLALLARAGEKPDVDLAAWIVIQAATGLHAAHELAGPDGQPLALVHRDVSPQNILLGFEGKVCVADFGIAKLQRLGSLQTESGYVKGKYAYMSPEQTRGGKLDRRSDVFSLGIVLHEALTGSRLFDLDGPGQVALAICDGKIPDPRTKRADIPEAYASVAMRALARDPGDRFETAEAMARALRATVRERHAAADEEHLRALLARIAGGDRDALAKRLERIASESAPELPPAEGSFGYATTVVDPVPPSMDSLDDARAEPPTPTPRTLPIDRGPRLAAVAAAVAILGGIGGAYAWLRPPRAPAASAVAPLASASPSTSDAPPPPVSPPAAEASAVALQPAPKATNDPKPLVRGRAAAPPVVRASASTSASPPAATPTATSSKGVPFRSPF